MTRKNLLPLLLAVALGGCAVFAVPEEPPRPTPLNPVWSADELEDHLEFLNDSDNAGRTTGTQGHARSASYVAARLSEFRLQPALGSDFRVVYEAPINYPVSAAMRAVGMADSLILLPGIDFIPDGRSDSGSVHVTRLALLPGDRGNLPVIPFGVVTFEQSTQELEAWRDSGARVVIQVSDLHPTLEATPVKDLLVVRATANAAGRLLGVPGTTGAADLSARAGSTVELGRRIYTRVTTNFQPQAGAINILGYLAGKHPVHARELVIVCADMDGLGSFAGIPVADYRNFGISAAALLEVARNLGYVARHWGYPERSVMVAVWSGSQLGHSGLRYFLHNPTWRLDRVVSVIYAGLSSADEEAVRGLLEPFEIPLIAVSDPEPLHSPEVTLRPDPALRRLSAVPAAVPEPDLEILMETAVQQALELADKTYRLTMVESTSHDPEPAYGYDYD